jgi:hypothetical protein
MVRIGDRYTRSLRGKLVGKRSIAQETRRADCTLQEGEIVTLLQVYTQ